MDYPEQLPRRIEVKDPLYGNVEINEPVLVELIESAPVQRLKHINQYGPPLKWYERRFGEFNRYDHSVGTMILLGEMGASVEEKAAGLLHDVAHTAFSHVGDWVFGDAAGEAYADDFHNKFIEDSGILDILEAYDIDKRAALEIKNFPLLESPAPALCADRLDYSLREAAGWLNPNLPSAVLKELVIYDDQLALNNIVAARAMAYSFLQLQEQHWASAGAILRFALLTRALKQGLNLQLIELSDFYQTDDHLINKLEAADDTRIQQIIKWLSTEIPYALTDDEADLTLTKKFRRIDPLVVIDVTAYRLSELDADFRKQLKGARQANKDGVKIKVFDPELLAVLKS